MSLKNIAGWAAELLVEKDDEDDARDPEFRAFSDSVLVDRTSSREISTFPSAEILVPGPQPRSSVGSANDPSAALLPRNADDYKMNKRWVYDMPRGFTLVVQDIDDRFTRAVQSPMVRCPLFSKFLVFASLFMTAATTIELGTALPAALLILGQDDLASFSCMCMLCLCLFSQIPKRFLWRPRPWMAGVAVPVRKDKSSSFPSRAVACGFTFGLILSSISRLTTISGYQPVWIIIVVPFAYAGLAAWARIFIGAHYLSDCVLGVMMGLFSCAVGFLGFFAVDSKCGHCYDGTCFKDVIPGDDSSQTWYAIEKDSTSMMIILFVSTFLMASFQAAPVFFWKKAGPLLAMLLPLIAFRLTYLCQTVPKTSLVVQINRVEVVVALFIPAMCTGLGKVGHWASKKLPKMRLLVLCLFYDITFVAVYVTLVAVRLRHA